MQTRDSIQESSEGAKYYCRCNGSVDKILHESFPQVAISKTRNTGTTEHGTPEQRNSIIPEHGTPVH